MRRKLFAIFAAVVVAAFIFLMLTATLKSNDLIVLAVSIIGGLLALAALFVALPSAPLPETINEKKYLQSRLLPQFEQEPKNYLSLTFKEFRLKENESDKPLREYANLNEVLSNSELKQFVLVGEAGAGKSTTLQHMAESVAKVRLNPAAARPDWLEKLYPVAASLANTKIVPLPLWINLGYSQNPAKIDDLLRFWWKDCYHLKGDVQVELDSNDLWLFLDGLNEIPGSDADRKICVESLRTLLKPLASKPVHVVISSRINHYDELDLNLPVVQIQSLKESDIASFINSYGGAKELIARIQEDDTLQRIAKNPYALLLLTEIYESDGLPNDLNDLYAKYTRRRYDKYQALTGDSPEQATKKLHLSFDILSKALGYLGFRMITARKGTLASTKWTEQQIRRRALEDGINLGVLRKVGTNIRFDHENLQGYFTLPELRRALQLHWYDLVRFSFALIIALPFRLLGWIGERLTLLFDADDVMPVWLDYRLNLLIGRRRILIRSIGDLGKTATPAVRVLIEALKDKNADIRSEAALALGEIGQDSDGATAALVDALKDENANVRSAAARALGDIGKDTDGAVTALIATLKDKSVSVRSAAARALGAFGEAAMPAVPFLIEILEDSYVNYIAAQALVQIGASVVSDLGKALRDADGVVRNTLIWVLKKIGPSSAHVLVHALYNVDVRLAAADALVYIGAPAVTAVVDGLKDENAIVRDAAAWVLERIGPSAASAVPDLINLLADQEKPNANFSDRVCDKAADALEKIGTPEALEAVLQWRKKEIDLPETPPNPNQIQIDT